MFIARIVGGISLAFGIALAMWLLFNRPNRNGSLLSPAGWMVVGRLSYPTRAKQQRKD
jgi:hypothetical protein